MTTLETILNKLPALSTVDKEHYLNDFKSCDLLILDDFGMERQTDYAREQVFGVIDGRYLAQRPLIVTTNLILKEMKSTNKLSAKRIYDRILEMCVPVCFGGESLRMAKAAEKLKRFRFIANGNRSCQSRYTKEKIDTACRERLEIIEKGMMRQEDVTEALKAADQMAWVRSMDSIHNRADEIILAELREGEI